MKLINTSGTRLFKIIPRYVSIGNVTVKLTSESTNVTIEKSNIFVGYRDVEADIKELNEEVEITSGFYLGIGWCAGD